MSEQRYEDLPAAGDDQARAEHSSDDTVGTSGTVEDTNIAAAGPEGGATSEQDEVE